MGKIDRKFWENTGVAVVDLVSLLVAIVAVGGVGYVLY